MKRILRKLIIGMVGITLSKACHSADGGVRVTREYIDSVRNFASRRIADMVDDLNRERRVSRGHLRSLHEANPALVRHHNGGIDLYKDRYFPVTFGVIGREPRMTINPDERKENRISLSAYIMLYTTPELQAQIFIYDETRGSYTPNRDRFSELYEAYRLILGA